MHSKTLYLVVLASLASNALSAPTLFGKKPSTPPPVVAKGPVTPPPAKGLPVPAPPLPPAKGAPTPPATPPAKGLATVTGTSTKSTASPLPSTKSTSGSTTNPGAITLNGKTLTLTFFAQGTRGEVFTIKENPNALAKRSKTGASLTAEGINTRAAGQLIDEGTASDKNFYLIIKKIPGNPLNKTPAAKNPKKDCSLLMAAARNLAAAAATKYASTPFDIKHNDLALGNILFTDSEPGSDTDSDDADSGLGAADLIDWGEATRTQAADASAFKLQVKQQLTTTIGFRDQDCTNNWAGIVD